MFMQVVKQTVMTSVYGVTFVGARKQIQVTCCDCILTVTLLMLVAGSLGRKDVRPRF